MSPIPETASPSRAPTSAWRLNVTVWSILLLLALAVVACMWGGTVGILVPLLLLPLVACVGLVTNLALCLWNAVHCRFRQARSYGLAFVLLAVVLFWLRDFVGNNMPHKIGG